MDRSRANESQRSTSASASASRSRCNEQKFLQILMTKGVMNARETKNILSEVCSVPKDSDDEIARFVQDINLSIAPFNLEIKKGIQEEDGVSFYCLVNTVETPISRLSSTYTPNELELFKKLVEQIVSTDDGKFGSLAALSLTDDLDKKMGKEEAQNFFNRLENDKWIQKGQDGKISLTVRCILELEQYLKEIYRDIIKDCHLCSKICLLGVTCLNCGIKLHRKCSSQFFKRPGQTCPAHDCRAVWGDITI